MTHAATQQKGQSLGRVMHVMHYTVPQPFTIRNDLETCASNVRL